MIMVMFADFGLIKEVDSKPRSRIHPWHCLVGYVFKLGGLNVISGMGLEVRMYKDYKWGAG